MLKKYMSFFMALAILLTIIPVPVFAIDEELSGTDEILATPTDKIPATATDKELTAPTGKEPEAIVARTLVPAVDKELEAVVDNAVGSYIRETYSSTAVPGAVVLVAKDGEILLEKAYGYAYLTDPEDDGPTSLLSGGARAVNQRRNEDKSTNSINGQKAANPVPMTTDTLFDLASITKIMATTQSIMKLVSEGKIDVDEKVAAYIPKFAQNGKEDVTVAQLLTHSSGISQWEPMYLLIDKDRDDVLDFICEQPLTLSGYKYSDLGFQTLGFLVEAVSGMSMDEYAKKEIYEPLGLSNITYNPLENGFSKDQVAATSWGNYYEMSMVDEVNLPGWSYNTKAYQDELTKFDAGEQGSGWRAYTLRGEVNDGNAAMAGGGIAGHAGLFATAGDLAVIGQMMLNGGTYNGVKIYDEKVIEDFTSLQYGSYYGYGFKLNHAFMGKDANINTFGHDGFTGTQIWFDKETNMIFVVLTNKMNVGSGTSYNAATGQYRPAYSNTLSNISPAVSNAVYSYLGGKEKLLSYSVKFQSNGGSTVKTQYLSKGDKAVVPEEPVKEGYSFDGWYSDKELTTPYGFDTPVDSSLTLYARWIESDIPAKPSTPTNKPARETSGGGTSIPDTDVRIIRNSATPQAGAPKQANQAAFEKLVNEAKVKEAAYVRTSHSAQYTIPASAWKALEGMGYMHDTVEGKAVQVRIYFEAPAQLDSDVKVSGYVKGAAVDRTYAVFKKFFRNDICVISLDQKGPWNQPVKIAAKVNLPGDSIENLSFYSYNSADNTFKAINAPKYWVDTNGYLHFYTDLAGDIVISVGPLEPR